MSAGRFTTSKYEMDSGDIVKIRVQPETLVADLGGANSEPAGDITISDLSARVSKSKRSFGVNARTVTVRFTGALPDGYSGDDIARIPILVKANFDGIDTGITTGTYLGSDVVIVGKSAETVK